MATFSNILWKPVKEKEGSSFDFLKNSTSLPIEQAFLRHILNFCLLIRYFLLNFLLFLSQFLSGLKRKNWKFAKTLIFLLKFWVTILSFEFSRPWVFSNGSKKKSLVSARPYSFEVSIYFLQCWLCDYLTRAVCNFTYRMGTPAKHHAHSVIFWYDGGGSYEML